MKANAEAPPSFSLAGEVALVLGGTGRLGRAIAGAVDGAALVAGRDLARAEAAAAEIPDARAVEVDAHDVASLPARPAAEAPHDHVVVAVANRAFAGGIDDTPPDRGRAAFGRLRVGHAVVHAAPRVVREGASVTLISDSGARSPVGGYGVWTTLHGAIEALARGAALDVAPIRVDVLSPGGIGSRPDRQLLRRAGRPEDIGQVAAMVTTSHAMTGAVIGADPGQREGDWFGEEVEA